MSDLMSLGVPGLIATVGGLGKVCKKAPGTVGSAFACVLAMWVPPQARLVLIAFLCIAGTWAAHVYARRAGVTDPQEVIVDEVAGQLIAMVGHVTALSSGALILPCFILFRVFDILKPWPVSACEKAPGGVGIMLDDVVAGLFANVTLFALRKFFLEGGWGGLA